jgi:hypothetical protein
MKRMIEAPQAIVFGLTSTGPVAEGIARGERQLLRSGWRGVG